ncbi:uncharacterized protein FMAN_14246 [Fusarium mangiferae]|uniref:Ubiquinol-cytochrome-c reductase cytochrome c1 n=1 Tax=Fusarium mangiferae TaxID=192010 RepID=A0A1L7UEP1_FUSMA|nr:uncharacterized protein FMAN_14246 [Fusarium mangiferae]CVL09118.1 uncharacterized protein FMAN_14246 [Fusarium mangiferae]
MTSDATAADMCRCAKAKGDDKIEAELGATVICPDCHLEESTLPEPDNAEQPDLISEKDVYVAFKGSSALSKIADKHPNDQSIRKAVRKREKSHQGVKDLIRKYGILSVVAAIRVLLDDNVFTSTESASRRFPTLFPKEQILNCEQGQETAAGDSSTKKIEPLDGECNHPNETADGFGAGVLPNSRPGQTLRDCRLLPKPRQRLMLQLQLILEHACFSFGQREMQQTLDEWDHSCAEAISLQTWIEFFQNNKTFKTEGNAESLPSLFSSVGRIQNIILLRLNLNFEEVNQFLLNAEEFIRLLDTPLYLGAVESLRQRTEEVLLKANRDAALIHNEAGGKVAEIEAQRERLNREEEGVKRHRDENLDNIQVSIERDIFAAMGQAKDTLPGIGLADNR